MPTANSYLGQLLQAGGFPPLEAMRLNPEQWHVDIDDFSYFPVEAQAATDGGTVYPGWTLTQATTGSAALATDEPHALALDSGSSTQGQGANLQKKGVSWTVAAGKRCLFLARFKVTDTIAKCQGFVGLSDSETQIFASNELNSSHLAGFFTNGSSALKIATHNGATSGVQTQSDSVATLVEDTYLWAGFVLTGAASLKAFVDGVAIDAITSDLPAADTDLFFSLACLSDGTNDPILTIDYRGIIGELDRD